MRHEGTDIAGELIILFLFHSKPNGGRAKSQEGTDIAVHSKPVAANEGADCGRATWMMEDVRKATSKRK